ncbi:MAG TPA: cupredoxin domain-containing protein [Frankiaceae bacterium]|nr:cupredoxin domain-containing protein [Frankiaceae bacterium]
MRYRAVPLAAALIATLSVAPTRAADTVITAAANTFVPMNLSVTAGDKLTFVNPDVAPHNVIAEATHKNVPLFRSDTITMGETAEVVGVDKLKPGTYTFVCTLHPRMRGALAVTAPGSLPVAVTPTTAAVPTPTSLAIFNGALYVASYAAGTVTSFPLLPGGLLGPGTPYATGFSSPLGVTFAPDGTMYVADSHEPTGAPRPYGRVWAVKGTEKKVVIDRLPNGRHATNNLTVHNGRLYVTNGNSTDDGVAGGPPEEPLSGTVLSYALPITAKSKPTVESRGLRNVYDVAFRPGTKSEAWFATNGPDELDPWGEDLLHKVDVAKGTADFGFPACVYKAPLVRGQNPAIPTPCRRSVVRPEVALGLHVSANGLAFGAGGRWGGDLYIAEYGSNVPPPTGHKIIRVPIVNGRAGTPQDLVVGLTPLDVVFGPEGLYVADFASGEITLLRAVA